MPRTVVIVDDHPTFRRFARRLLEQAGFEVVAEAEDGAAALATVKRHAPDLVLLDVMLPDESGVRVAERLAAQSPATDVVLTSSRTADDLGIDGNARFVRKDELVLERLTELLGAAG